MTIRGHLLLGLLLSGTALGEAPPAEGPAVIDLGRLPIDAPVEQTVEFDNPLAVELEMEAVQLTPPLVATRWTKRIAAGARGSFAFRLGEPRDPGPYEGRIVVRFADPTLDPLVFDVRATLVAPIEIVPYPAIFLATRRGVADEASIEIVNHRESPLRFGPLPAADDRRSLSLEAIEPGRRYRLVARMSGAGDAGRRTERVELAVEGAAPIAVQLHTLLNERVYSFPDEVSFGSLPLEILRDPESTGAGVQTLMVFRKEQPGFELSATSSLPFVRVAAEPAPSGDRWQLTISLDPGTTPPGPIEGRLVVETNDPEFPRLEVPIRGEVLAPR